MSAREKVLKNIDYMSETFLDKVYTLWIDEEALRNDECPICKAHDYQFGEETMMGIEEARNSGFVEYDSFEDFLKAVEEMEEEN
ncbi:MAG: hypothetical protein LBM59_00485 [Ruminococcus sp.]|jgi:hypothetical protein|nr:hypothetical protein [Ruminococcus sp.]